MTFTRQSLLSLGLSEFSQIQGVRTHCTEGKNQTAVLELEPSTDLTKVFTAQIFAFPKLNDLGVGQFLEMFFRSQEAQSSKALCLALPETPPQFFQPSFPLLLLLFSTSASQNFSGHEFKPNGLKRKPNPAILWSEWWLQPLLTGESWAPTNLLPSYS